MKGTVYHIPEKIRREVSIKSGGICHWCKKKASRVEMSKRQIPLFYDEDGKKYHLDHIKPVREGGNHTESNLVLSCRPCNYNRNRIVVKDKRIKELFKDINGSPKGDGKGEELWREK